MSFCAWHADLTDSGMQAYKFIAVFKWEFRKGWDVLVSAFARAFVASDNVRTTRLRDPATADSTTTRSCCPRETFTTTTVDVDGRRDIACSPWQVLLYLLTRQWDDATGTQFHAAMERHLLAHDAGLGINHVNLVLSRIKIITKVQHVRLGCNATRVCSVNHPHGMRIFVRTGGAHVVCTL